MIFHVIFFLFSYFEIVVYTLKLASSVQAVNTVIGMLILGQVQKVRLLIHPAINLPIIPPFGVWRVWAIITYAP